MFVQNFIINYPMNQEKKNKDLHQMLVKLAFPGDEGRVFAYEYRKKFKENGWEVYDFEREYTRMGAIKENRYNLAI